MLLYCCLVSAEAQTVNRLKATFTECHVEVKYDLDSSIPIDVVLQYSGDDGKTWHSCTTVSGDLTGQSSGNNKLIIWDNQTDNIRWGKFSFRIRLPNDCVMINGVCWATRNVGEPGTFADNPEDAGMFYQWNRTKAWPATGDITGWDSSVPAGTTWETANNVCPSGYRLPTSDELLSLISGQWTTLNGVNGCLFGSGDNTIFLPATGYRISSYGLFNDTGACCYWSSTSNTGLSAYYLYCLYNNIYRNSQNRNFGLPVRCVAE